MSKEKGCKCCEQIWYVDMLDKKWGLCPNCYGYCKPLIDDLKIKDKRIKELEEELDDAKRDYIPKLEFGLQRANKMGRDAEKEIQQLKQQLHDLPKKIVEEIRDVAGDYWDFNICEECGNVPDLNTLTMEDFDEILDAILEKFGGEDESK